ncbi:MAG TPA: hypothetical protein VHG08_03270 [Longimicrobium sp.]|nr:hypothetical protein [Longimicrobium sp.]
MLATQRAARPFFAGVFLLAAACADTIEPPTGSQDPSFTAAENPRAQGRHRSLDDEFADLAREIPGFGGYYYDGETPVVRLKDLAQRGRAQAVLARTFAASGEGQGMRFVGADFGFDELKAWADRLPAVLALDGVVFTDIDEARNRLTIGVEDAGGRARALARLAELAIPSAAVVVEEADPFHFTATLQDYNRPLEGGLQISFSGIPCTLGFNADLFNGQRGFITNSHCTDVRGSVRPSLYYQPTTASGLFIGTEVKDPPFFNSISNSACPSGRLCRYSDAAYVAYDAAAPWEFGSIARTTGRGQYTGSLTIDAANPRFAITAKRWTNPILNQTVDKIGLRTGWTTGRITRTCYNANVQNTSYTMLCQYVVNAGADGGDSGSPVFYWWDPVQVTLFGIQWGANTARTEFIFSWIGHVENELGPMNVTRTIDDGSEEPPPTDPPGDCPNPGEAVCGIDG